MGQTLSEPVTTKHSDEGSDARLAYAVSEMQGWRLSMEDAHATILQLDDPALQGSSSASLSAERAKAPDGNGFFAVYDGHGGGTVARFAGDTVHYRLRQTPAYKAGKYEQALKDAFLKTDEDLLSNPEFQADPSGCTAVAALFTTDGKILVANAGDSRSILSCGGEAKAMSHDHKPVNEGEQARITAAGGFVEFGRVNGNLALSRALGDFEFKRSAELDAEHQIVTADPDIITHDVTAEDEFLIIACDGIWDVLTSQQTVDFVRRTIAQGNTLKEVVEKTIDLCLAPDSDWGGVGCDNMTMLVVALLGGRTQEEWYAWVTDRVNKGVGYATPRELPQPFTIPPRNDQVGVVGRGAGGIPGSLVNVIQGSLANHPIAARQDAEKLSTAPEGSAEALRRDTITIGDDAAMETDEPSAPETQMNAETPHPAVQAEGLSDKSEDPTLNTASE